MISDGCDECRLLCTIIEELCIETGFEWWISMHYLGHCPNAVRVKCPYKMWAIQVQLLDGELIVGDEMSTCLIRVKIDLNEPHMTSRFKAVIEDITFNRKKYRPTKADLIHFDSNESHWSWQDRIGESSPPNEYLTKYR